MAHAQGMSRSIYLMAETSPKTLPGTVTADKVAVIDPSFRPVRNKFTSQALTGSAEPRPTIFGKVGVEWDCRAEFNPSSADPWLKYLVGNREVFGTADLFHIRYHLGDLASMAVEDKHAILAKFLGYRGLYVGSGSFTFNSEGPMEASFSGLGLKALASAGSTAINSTITDRTGMQPFSYLFGRIKRAGVTLGYCKVISADLNRNLGKDMAIDETNEMAVIFSEVATLGGRIEAHFTEVTLYDDAIGTDETSLEIFVPYGEGQCFLLILPSVVLDPFTVQGQGTGLITLQGAWTAQGIGSTKARVQSKWFTSEALNGLTLVTSLDGAGDVTTTFGAITSPDDAVTAINAATTGMTARVERMAGETGGCIVIEHDTPGTGTIQVKSSSTAEVLLGFDTLSHAGLSNVSAEFWVMNKVG